MIKKINIMAVSRIPTQECDLQKVLFQKWWAKEKLGIFFSGMILRVISAQTYEIQN